MSKMLSIHSEVWDAFSDAMVTQFGLEDTDENSAKMEVVLEITVMSIFDVIGNA